MSERSLIAQRIERIKESQSKGAHVPRIDLELIQLFDANKILTDRMVIAVELLKESQNKSKGSSAVFLHTIHVLDFLDQLKGDDK